MLLLLRLFHGFFIQECYNYLDNKKKQFKHFLCTCTTVSIYVKTYYVSNTKNCKNIQYGNTLFGKIFMSGTSLQRYQMLWKTSKLRLVLELKNILGIYLAKIYVIIFSINSWNLSTGCRNGNCVGLRLCRRHVWRPHKVDPS